MSTAAEREIQRVGLVVVVVACAVAVVIAPVIGVFFLWVALNHLLGTAENVPFSRYPMFAQPRERSWALRFEGPTGSRLNIADLGILPPTARKRFAAEVQSAQQETGDPAIARAQAAEVIAAWVNTRRPALGPIATEPIAIVLMEYEFDGRVVAHRRSVLTVATPP